MCIIYPSICENCSSEEIFVYIQHQQEREGEASANYWGPGVTYLSYVLIFSRFALAWRPKKFVSLSAALSTCQLLKWTCSLKYYAGYIQVQLVRKVTFLLLFFFFFFLGPVCISSGSTAAFKAYCAYPKYLTAQIHYPCGSYKETKVPNWGCAYFFLFNNRFPKSIIALSSQCLAAVLLLLHERIFAKRMYK
jgi:hypothetical protein